MTTVGSVVVSGGRSGIGAAVVEALLLQGWSVAVADLKIAAPDQVSTGLVDVPVCDVSDPESVQQFFDTLRGAQLAPGALVHCAGIYPAAPFEATDFDTWRRVQATNLDSFFLLAKHALPIMRQNGWGRVVAVSSNTVFDAVSGLSAYIASKAGMIGLVRALAREYGEDGVTVNAIAPSITRTPTTESAFDEQGFAALVAKQAIPRLAEPRDYPGVIEFLLSDASAFMTGQTLIVDGGWTVN